MANYTENYNLTIPETEDNFDILDYNENFEAIDTVLAEHETQMNEVNEKLGTPEDGETVFSLLKSGGTSAIKSIQHVFFNSVAGKSTGTVVIDTVNPNNCIVILERLRDASGCYELHYTLNETNISVSHQDNISGDSLQVGFWVIEFN